MSCAEVRLSSLNLVFAPSAPSAYDINGPTSWRSCVTTRRLSTVTAKPLSSRLDLFLPHLTFAQTTPTVLTAHCHSFNFTFLSLIYRSQQSSLHDEAHSVVCSAAARRHDCCCGWVSPLSRFLFCERLHLHTYMLS